MIHFFLNSRKIKKMIPANLKEQADDIVLACNSNPFVKAVYSTIPSWANLYDFATLCNDEKVSFKIYKFIVEKDEKDSKKAYCIDAKYNYGVHLLNGLGCVKNPDLAFKMFNENKKKCPDSMHNYGYCLMLGIGCEPDEQEALNVWKTNSLKHQGSAKNYQTYLDSQPTKRQKCESD
jgi:TPR repeat protein